MSVFKFKYFDIKQADSAMKVGTDAMILGSLINSDGMSAGLDIGSGTGVLSLMIAQNNPSINIQAVEIDQLSSDECRFNFESSNWSDRLFSHCSDFLKFLPTEKFDLIFSNPPYYSTTNLSQDARVAIAKHECSLPIDSFVSRVELLLQDDGCFWVIIPASEEPRWQAEGLLNRLNVTKRIYIKGKAEKTSNRCVLCFERRKGDEEEVELVVRNENGNYTDQYIDLTSSFHGVDLRKLNH